MARHPQSGGYRHGRSQRKTPQHIRRQPLRRLGRQRRRMADEKVGRQRGKQNLDAAAGQHQTAALQGGLPVARVIARNQIGADGLQRHPPPAAVVAAQGGANRRQQRRHGKRRQIMPADQRAGNTRQRHTGAGGRHGTPAKTAQRVRRAEGGGKRRTGHHHHRLVVPLRRQQQYQQQRRRTQPCLLIVNLPGPAVLLQTLP